MGLLRKKRKFGNEYEKEDIVPGIKEEMVEDIPVEELPNEDVLKNGDETGNIQKNSEDEIENNSEDKNGDIQENSTDENEDSESVTRQDEEKVEIEETDPLERFREDALEFAKEKDFTDEELENGLEQIRNIGEGWKDGKLTTEMLELVVKGLGFEKAMERISTEAELRGRNAAIEEGFMQEIPSDGLPHLGSGGSIGEKGRFNSIFDLAREAGNS